MADAYFTVEHLRTEVPALADEEDYPDASIETAREDVEEALEGPAACNVAFVAREATETLTGDGSRRLALAHRRALSVVTCALDGLDLPAGEVTIGRLGRATREAGWPLGAEVEITYVHGYATPPARIRRAAVRLCAHFLVNDGINDRVTRAEAGEERLWLAPFEPFGIPEVDAAVRDHREVEVLVR